MGEHRPWWKGRWQRRMASALALGVLFYLGFLLAGFCPVNLNCQAPAAADRVVLFVRSNEIHTDIVMPVVDLPSGIDWRELFPPDDFYANVQAAKHVAIGWGNKGFYIETPRWADLKAATLLGAVFPSEAVLHVEYVSVDARDDDACEVAVSRERYRALAEFIRATVEQRDAAGHAQTATHVTYGATDRFYFATGRYHAFNTCNQWTGRGLKRAGVPIGIWTPLKQQVLFWLPTTESHSDQDRLQGNGGR